MDIELNTLHLMARFTPPAVQGNEPQHRDYKPYKKRVRKTTRDLLNGKSDLPEHVVGNFREYVESLIRVYEAVDAHQAYQGEYAGLPAPGVDDTTGGSVPQESSIEATTRLLSAPLTPEAAVKQGLGVVTHKKKVTLPENVAEEKIRMDTNAESTYAKKDPDTHL